MLTQIGQDMVTAEQQIRAHKSQTRRTVQLKRLLPEYELSQEKNLYKCLAIATDARKLIEGLDMKSLQELRSVTKAEPPIENTLAAVIMIRKFKPDYLFLIRIHTTSYSEITNCGFDLAERCETAIGKS